MPFVFALCLWACAVTPQPFDQQEGTLVRLINDYRVDHNLQPLEISPSLMEVAEWTAQDMMEKERFSHTDSLGRDAIDRMTVFGYPEGVWMAENLAVGYKDPGAVFRAWRRSDGHDTIMLGGHFHRIGVARACNPRCYWVAEFGG